MTARKPASTLRSVAIVSSIAIAGCSATPEIRDVSALAEGAEVGGIPYRPLLAVDVGLWELDERKGTYVERKTLQSSIPHPHRILALGYSGQLLADPELQVKLNPDGTLQLYKLTSSPKPATDAATGFKDAVTAFRTEVTARKTELTAAGTAADTARAEAVKARNAVESAQGALDAAIADGKESAIISARAALIVAQRNANVAYLRAGLFAPYPEVSILP